MEKEITEIYGSRVRVRVCGLCWKEDKLLMVKHKSLQKEGFWSPPGGGIDFGQSIEETLKKTSDWRSPKTTPVFPPFDEVTFAKGMATQVLSPLGDPALKR